MNADKLSLRYRGGASLSKTENGFRFTIPESRLHEFRLAELDDITQQSRRSLSHHSLDLSLRARASAESMPGTWGFGVWNDPFGLSLGFGGNPFQLPALPNAAWFFHASEENYLSFRDPQVGGRVSGGVSIHPSGYSTAAVSRPPAAANGFLAQVFRSPRFDARLIPAGLAFPFSRKTTRRWLGRVIAEEGVALSVDVTQWHAYRLRWSPTRTVFEVDDAVVLETSVSPRPPLGLVIWMDNQYAAFTPEGKIGFGILENPEPAWLEIEDLKIGSI
ncbi:MAG: hypothetical protein ACOYZ8_12280 [Chloroflexota bacterium]